MFKRFKRFKRFKSSKGSKGSRGSRGSRDNKDNIYYLCISELSVDYIKPGGTHHRTRAERATFSKRSGKRVHDVAGEMPT